MLTTEFHDRARTFLQSLLRQRDYLIATGKCKKNAQIVCQAASHIRIHLNANGYRSTRQMMHFWNENEYKIRILLPGIGSRAHESMLTAFNSLNYEAQSYQRVQIEELFTFSQS